MVIYKIVYTYNFQMWYVLWREIQANNNNNNFDSDKDAVVRRGSFKWSRRDGNGLLGAVSRAGFWIVEAIITIRILTIMTTSATATTNIYGLLEYAK